MAEEEGKAEPDRKNESKPWTPERPFQRLNSPSFSLGRAPLDGDGHSRGTRRLTDAPGTVDLDVKKNQKAIDNADIEGTLKQIPILSILGQKEIADLAKSIAKMGLGITNALINRLFEQGARMTPNWVKTLGELSNGPNAEHAAEQEVFGKMLRSFQTWTDVPGFQWHRWYDWNLHVKPEKAFDWVRGEGNRVELDPPKKDPKEPDLSQFVEGSLECEWDCGSIGPLPGPMFTDLNRGLTSNWFWPMTHDWVWVVGRSIYDGGHEFGEPLRGRSELHPVKAMATVRTEAMVFANEQFAVPATQFLFFASTLGGYSDFDTLAPVDGNDYEFIVDLPRRPNDFIAPSHNIGAAPDFPFNRLALRRPEPRFEIDFTPYQNAFGALALKQLQKDFQPTVSFVTPDPTRPDEVQARIKIPLTALAAKNPNVKSYGVQVTLGWPDPNQTQAKKVKKVSVTFTKIHPVTGIEKPGEWRAKLAINRRWFHIEQRGMIDEKGFTIPRRGQPPLVLPVTDFKQLPPTVSFFLPEDQHVEVHSHIWELNAMDRIYLKPNPDRTVMFNRIQLFAEAVRTGEDPSTVLPGDDLSDIGTAIASIPLIVIDAIEGVPVVGAVFQFVELLLSSIPGAPKISPTRLLGMIGERPAVWKDHIDKQPPRVNSMHVVQRVIMRNALLMMADSFGDENAPLAILDAGLGFDDENAKNPLPVKDDGQTNVKLTAVALKDDAELAELFEFKRTGTAAGFQRNLVRYELEYQVNVSAQIPS